MRRLGLVGDLGQTENSAQTLDHLTGSNPQSVINVGDLSYADGYQPRWDTWGRLIAPHTSRFAWAVIEGNHELEVRLLPHPLLFVHLSGCCCCITVLNTDQRCRRGCEKAHALGVSAVLRCQRAISMGVLDVWSGCGQVANGRTGFLAYETRFWFPSKESRSYSPFYYSYEVNSNSPHASTPVLHARE